MHVLVASWPSILSDRLPPGVPFTRRVRKIDTVGYRHFSGARKQINRCKWIANSAVIESIGRLSISIGRSGVAQLAAFRVQQGSVGTDGDDIRDIPTSSLTSMRSVCATETVMPVRRNCLKPGTVAVS